MGREKYNSRILTKRIETIDELTLMINKRAQEIVNSVETYRKESIAKLENLKTRYLFLLSSENFEGQESEVKTKIITNYTNNIDTNSIQNYFSQQFFEEEIKIRGTNYAVKQLKNDYSLHIKGHSGRVNGVAITSDNKCAITSDLDGVVRIWDLESGIQKTCFENNKGWVDTLLLSQDNKHLLFSGDKSIKIYNLPEKTLEFSLENTKTYPNSILISHDGSYIAYGVGKSIRVFDFRNNSEIALLKKHSSLVKFVTATFDANIIVSVSKDNEVFIWNIRENIVVDYIKYHNHKITCIASGFNSKYLVIGKLDRTLDLLDIQFPELKYNLTGHNHAISCATITPSANYILSCAYFEIFIWNTSNKFIESKFVGHTHNVISICVSNDEKYVLSGGETARLWDFQNKSQINVLENHRDKIIFVSPTSDNKYIVSCDKESLRVWDIQEKKQVNVIKENFRFKTIALTKNNYLVVSKRGEKVRVLKIK